MEDVPTPKRSGARLAGLALVALVVAIGLAAALGPAGGERVVVYTAHAQEDLDRLLPALEAATGLRAEVVKASSSEVRKRLEAEAAAPQADVVWAIAPDQLEQLGALLEPVPAPEPVDPALVVSPAWHPYSVLTVALVVNTKLVPEAEAPRRWADLAEPRWKGHVAMARPDSSGSALMQLVTITELLGPERGWEVYRGLVTNARLAPSSSAVPKLVADGEARVGLTLEDLALRHVKQGEPVRLVYPEEGTTCAPDGVAVVKGAPRPAAARAFVAWALSKATQDLVGLQVGRRPARPGAATPEGLPAALKTIPYPFTRARAEHDALLARWKALAAELGR